MNNVNKVFVLVLITLFFASFSFSEHTVLEDLQICQSFDNSSEKCSSYLALTKEVAQIIDLSYSKDQNLSDYINCIEDQKQALNFDYVSARNNCYMEQVRAQLKPKLNCFSDLNGRLLDITCKGVFPSDDYDIDFFITKNINNALLIAPKIQLDPNFSFDGSRFILFKKSYDLVSMNLPITKNIQFLPLNIEINNIDSLDSLFKSKNIKNIILDPVSRANLDCIAIKVLLGQKIFDRYSIKKSGLTVLFTYDQIIESCSDDVSYAFSLNLETYNKKKKQFFDIIDLRLNNFLRNSEFKTEAMIMELSEIIDEYRKFYIFEAELNDKTDVTFKISLDTDYFLSNLQKVTKELKDEEKKIVLATAGTTLLRNKEDNLSVKRKNKLSAILEFFKEDLDSIEDDSIRKIYYDIEYSLIKDYFENSDLVNITNVSSTISSSGISLDRFVFEISKPLYLEYSDDKNLQVLKDQNGLIIGLSDYNIDTLLAFNINDNQFLVNNKAIIFIDLNTLKEMYRGNAKVTNVSLYLEDDLPIYLVKKEVFGKLLGIIQVKELVTTKYYATTGLVMDVKKPWWDFLIIYN